MKHCVHVADVVTVAVDNVCQVLVPDARHRNGSKACCRPESALPGPEAAHKTPANNRIKDQGAGLNLAICPA